MNNLKVLDLFSGCGGLSLGFKLAGFKIAGAIDHDTDSIETFKKNFGAGKFFVKDINQINKEFIKKNYNNVDVIIGGPPCQGFSNANRWHKNYSDPRNLLFLKFIEFVKIIKPKMVLIENVSGILSRSNGEIINNIKEILNKNGYKVDYKLLNASEFGVPQIRKRVFIVGNRLSSTEFFENLKNHKKVTVKDAISELYALEKKTEKKLNGKLDNDYIKYLRKKNSKVLNHDIVYPAKSTIEKIKHVKQGENWQSIPVKLFKNNRNNRHSSAFKRLKEDDFSVTIDTGNAHSNYFHPIYNRIPTPREAARIQSFTDNFEFIGSRTSQYRQIGNAVPPLLAKEIAKNFKKVILNK
jgi:DNA (cytosine-5)-methyltransferase 1